MYLSIKQAAEQMGVHPKTLYRYIDAGKLPIHKLSPKCIRVDECDIAAYMDSIKEERNADLD